MTSLMVFDTSYLYFRAFFGVPNTFYAPDGRPTGALRGTLDFISRLATQYRPDQLACAWDDDWRPQWRVDLVPSYKTHRLASAGSEEVDDDLSVQIPMIREALTAAGLPVIGAPDHEADDVLASLAKAHEGKVWVVTGDRDLFQLISEQVQVIYVARGVAHHALIGPAELRDKYALEPHRYVDFAVLRGDPSDGLPGVKGIGEKTAAMLVSRYPTLEAMVTAAEDPNSDMPAGIRGKLRGSKDYLHQARAVVTCVDTLQLPTPQRGIADEPRLDQLASQWGVGGALQRLRAALTA